MNENPEPATLSEIPESRTQVTPVRVGPLRPFNDELADFIRTHGVPEADARAIIREDRARRMAEENRGRRGGHSLEATIDPTTGIWHLPPTRKVAGG